MESFILTTLSPKGSGMISGADRIYKFCDKKFGLKPSHITNIEKKKTYKNFVEYTVHWSKDSDEGVHVFKLIVKENEEWKK
ncbi:MAG: hypothetical protein V2I33_07385 [Kangiellaceae bacterium]|jgi:hypothetical protein|nr:hypothetical protein [Kangiellaceae bacterium]